MSGLRYSLAHALVCKARLARALGEVVTADTVGHRALSTAADMSAQARVVDALEVLAGVAGDMDSHQEAARLFGAAAGIRESTGYARCVSERDADLASLRKALGTPAFDAAFSQGQELSLGGAIAYARRGRGDRKRPSSGWLSLTPTENQIVELVCQGLSNPEIGERMFCSRRTVQTHLAHVFAKLRISSRAELTAQAARKPGQPSP